MSNALTNLMELALKAHSGQKDKGGKPYILHPWRVSLNVYRKAIYLKSCIGLHQDYFDDAVMACVGHDLVEDTSVTLNDLRGMGLRLNVLTAIDNLTKRDGEPYFAFIDRCKTSPVSRIAKICDIIDNLDKSRIPPSKRTVAMQEKWLVYEEALLRLGVNPDEFNLLLS